MPAKRPRKPQRRVRRDHPIDFFDMSWIAVKDGDPAVVMKVLSLSDPIPVTWRQGVHAVVGDFWDFDEDLVSSRTRVFVSPLVNGWLLAVGGYTGQPTTSKKSMVKITEWCCTLSREFGEAHAFTSQGRADWYSWILTKNGKVSRRYWWDDGERTAEGKPSPAEVKDRQEEGDDWQPYETTVMAVAGATSIDPTLLGPKTKSVGQGFLAKTALGRKHGVPKRPLDD